jgi:predicted transcriptional regulator
VLKILVAEPGLEEYEIAERISEKRERVQKVLEGLRNEGFLKHEEGSYSLEA